MVKINCFTCRDEGLPNGCPDCGKVKDIVINKEAVKTSTIIPDFYKDLIWDYSIFLKDREGDLSKVFGSQLQKIVDIFKNRIPAKSAIITAPPRSSKSVFMFTCIKFAYNYTKSISRILTTPECKKMLREGEVEELSKDLCFVRVPSIFSKYESDEIIRELLIFRANQNKPTFIISDFPIRQIMPKQLQSIIDMTGKENGLRYPALIEMFE